MKQQPSFILVLICFVLDYGLIFSQPNNKPNQAPWVVGGTNSWSLTSADSVALVQLPLLTAQHIKHKSSLPAFVNNSVQPYFRPLFEQVSVECNQYAGIAFTFTYEMNYARKTPANHPDNQYPTHYTFNFGNGGWGWEGVSYFTSFEIARMNGHPSVTDYGGMNEAGPSMWMTGYEKYYQGMFNKLESVYQIPAGTSEGLLVLKNWLHNHLNGDEIGGIACFCSASPWNATMLPPDTPEGGKHVITQFSGKVGHANTLVGYNDSIRYDYNQDGQYTNDVDINNDGLIDMRDWEIGGLLFTDSYLGGINWADSGFCYMMYKTLAETPPTGGIWNHSVHVVKVKESYEPQLTMKAAIKHPCRNSLKIYAGISADPDKDWPDYTLEFPLFNFQGGCQYMQGGWDPEATSIEIGLDITPLLSYAEPNSFSRFFLLIEEEDPNSNYWGLIENFTLIDYTYGQTHYYDPGNNIPLINNGITAVSYIAKINLSKPVIATQQLPVALTHEPYSLQFTASGGIEPYEWHLVRNYSEQTLSADMPEINDIQVSFNDTIHATSLIVPGFSFPFYGKLFDSVYIHTDGFLMFDEQQYPWPYLHNEHLMIRNTQIITPFLNKYLYIRESANNGVWYENTQDYLAIRWNMTTQKPNLQQLEFALILYSSGLIEFIYSGEPIPVDHNWACGISAGDWVNYRFTAVSNQKFFPAGQKVVLMQSAFPSELTLSKDGLLSGTTQQNYNNVPVEILVTDYMNLSARKTFDFNSWVAGTDPAEQNKNNLSFWVSPNPFQDKITLSFYQEDFLPVEVRLLDIYGKVICRMNAGVRLPGNQLLEWTPEYLPDNGVYFLILRVGDRECRKKIVHLK